MKRSTVLLIIALSVGAHIHNTYRPFSFLKGDGTFYAHINESLSGELSYRQEAHTATSWYRQDQPWNRNLTQDWSNVALGSEGEYYPKHAILMPTVAEPFFLLLGYDGLLLFNVIMMLLGAGLSLSILARYERSGEDQQSIAVPLVVLLVYLSPAVREHAYSFSNDVFSAALFLGGLWCLPGRSPLLGGLLWGATVWTKPVHVLAVGVAGLPFLVDWLRRHDHRTLLRAGGGFLAVIVLQMFVNGIWFGSPLATSYDRILVRVNGSLGIASARDAFNTSYTVGLNKLLFSRTHGILVGFPMLYLTPLGCLALAWRRSWWPLVSSVIAITGLLAVYGRYDYPDERFAFVFLFFALVPLVAFVEEVEGLLERAWAALSARSQGRNLALLLAALLLGGSVVYARIAQTLTRSVSDVSLLDATRVLVDDKTPCDHLNLVHCRWECPKVDKHSWEMLGLPRDDECRIEERDDWVRFPVAKSWKSKSLEITPPPGATTMRWWITVDPKTPRTVARLQVPGSEAKDARWIRSKDGVLSGQITVPPGRQTAATVAANEAGDAPGTTLLFRVDENKIAKTHAGALCLRWRFD